MGQASSCCVDNTSIRSKQRSKQPGRKLLASYHIHNDSIMHQTNYPPTEQSNHSITSPLGAPNSTATASFPPTNENHSTQGNPNNGSQVSERSEFHFNNKQKKSSRNHSNQHGNDCDKNSLPLAALTFDSHRTTKPSTFKVNNYPSNQINNTNTNQHLNNKPENLSDENLPNNNNDILNLMSTSDEQQIQGQLQRYQKKQPLNLLSNSEGLNSHNPLNQEINICQSDEEDNLLKIRENRLSAKHDQLDISNHKQFQNNEFVMEPGIISFTNSSIHSSADKQGLFLSSPALQPPSKYFLELAPLIVTPTASFPNHYYNRLCTSNQVSKSYPNGQQNRSSEKIALLTSRIQKELQEISMQASYFINESELGNGGASTAFAHGAYLFDVFIPDDYPKQPPRLHFVTPPTSQKQSSNKQKYRFSPKLLPDGRVALNILGISNGTTLQQYTKRNRSGSTVNTSGVVNTSNMLASNETTNSNSGSRVCASCRSCCGELATQNKNNTSNDNHNANCSNEPRSASTTLLSDVLKAIQKEIFCSNIYTDDSDYEDSDSDENQPSMSSFPSGNITTNTSAVAVLPNQQNEPVSFSSASQTINPNATHSNESELMYCSNCKNNKQIANQGTNQKDIAQGNILNNLGADNPFSRGDSSCRNSTTTTTSNLIIQRNNSNKKNNNSTSLNLSQMYASGYRDVVKYANVAHAIIDVLEDCGIKPNLSTSIKASNTSSNKRRESTKLVNHDKFQQEGVSKSVFASFKTVLLKHFTLMNEQIIMTIKTWIKDNRKQCGENSKLGTDICSIKITKNNVNYDEDSQYQDRAAGKSINLQQPLYTGIVNQHNREITQILETKSLAVALQEKLQILKLSLETLRS